MKRPMVHTEVRLESSDYRGAVFLLHVDVAGASYERCIREADLGTLGDLIDAVLDGEKVERTPNWRDDKYPEQSEPELAEREAPVFNVTETDGRRFVLEIEEYGRTSFTLDGIELGELGESIRRALTPYDSYDYDEEEGEES